MRILNISKFHFDFKGGVEKEARRVSKQLSKKHEVDTICFAKTNKLEILGKNERIISFKCFRFFSKVDISLKQTIFLLTHITKYDVIWLHYPNIIPVFTILLRGRRKKTVIQYQNDIQVLKLLYFLFKPFEKILLNNSDMIITSSPNYHLYSKALLNHEKKILPIPIRIPNIITSNEKKPFQIGDIIKITTLGRYTDYKGYEKLIDIVKTNKSINLNIISSSEFPISLEKKIESTQNINLLRGLNDSEVNAALLQSDAFVLSSISRNEGFGIVLLEALRLGLPICVNKLEGTGSEFITKPGYNGEFFDIDNGESLYSALNKICSFNKYSIYSNGAKEDFRKRFCINKKNEFLEALENIISL